MTQSLLDYGQGLSNLLPTHSERSFNSWLFQKALPNPRKIVASSAMIYKGGVDGFGATSASSENASLSHAQWLDLDGLDPDWALVDPGRLKSLTRAGPEAG